MKRKTQIAIWADNSDDRKRLIKKINKLILKDGDETNFSYTFFDGDPRLAIVENFLHDAGWIWEQEAREIGTSNCPTYSQWFTFEYDHDDIASAPYATMFPTSGLTLQRNLPSR